MDNVEIKEISILPDRSLMPKIGQTGYSVSQALAELVDNSIDARPLDKSVTISITLDEKNDTVEVSDDGLGMDEQTAANSMKLAHSTKINQLGEFGLGLKTAATSLGEQFEIITTPANSDKEYIIGYDEKSWLEIGDWTKHQMKIRSGVDKDTSGTTIRIKKLKFSIYPNLSGRIRKDLAARFAPYIENGEVKIKVERKWCEPEPLILKTDYCSPTGKEEFDIVLESGNRAKGWRGLLQKGSDRGEYGFRVFRRGRLIMQFAKIGFNPHPEARQIVGELHLDHVPVTHNKREFIEESPLYQELIKEGGIFWNFMREIVREARSSMRKAEISQGILDKMEVQKNSIMRAIKQLPELKQYAFPDLDKRVRGTKDENDGRTDLEIEQRDPRDMVTIEEQPISTNDRGRKPQKTHVTRSYFITINGHRFKVEHSFIDFKTESIMKDKNVDPDKGIQVFTNIAFPGFANTKDHVFYGAWHIAEAIAEIMVEHNNRPVSEMLEIRDKILKKSAEITRDIDELEQEKKIAERLKQEYEERMAKIKEAELEHQSV